MNNYTKEYIEQVTNNPDIQKFCSHNKGDWFWNGEKPVVYCKSGLGSFNPHDYKWLLTLGDLFELDIPMPEDEHYFGQKWEEFHAESLGSLVMNDAKEEMLDWVMYIYFDKEWNFNNKAWEVIK